MSIVHKWASKAEGLTSWRVTELLDLNEERNLRPRTVEPHDSARLDFLQSYYILRRASKELKNGRGVV